MTILEMIDPEKKYFTDRSATVLAPKDSQEQAIMVQNHKSFLDFLDPRDKSKHTFSKEELDKCIIIDD
jgi:hypothetical protein